MGCKARSGDSGVVVDFTKVKLQRSTRSTLAALPGEPRSVTDFKRFINGSVGVDLESFSGANCMISEGLMLKDEHLHDGSQAITRLGQIAARSVLRFVHELHCSGEACKEEQDFLPA